MLGKGKVHRGAEVGAGKWGHEETRMNTKNANGKKDAANVLIRDHS